MKINKFISKIMFLAIGASTMVSCASSSCPCLPYPTKEQCEKMTNAKCKQKREKFPDDIINEDPLSDSTRGEYVWGSTYKPLDSPPVEVNK